MLKVYSDRRTETNYLKKTIGHRTKSEQKNSLKLKVYISENLLSFSAPFLFFWNLLFISMHLINASPTIFENKRGSSWSRSKTLTYNANKRFNLFENRTKIFACYIYNPCKQSLESEVYWKHNVSLSVWKSNSVPYNFLRLMLQHKFILWIVQVLFLKHDWVVQSRMTLILYAICLYFYEKVENMF